MLTTLPDLDQFAVWLQGRPWGEIVGTRLSVRCCPLAIWLRVALGLPGVSVDDAHVRVYTAAVGWQEWPTPEPYRHFIEAIDYGGMGYVEVNVAEAKEVLKQIIREQKPDRKEVPDTKTQE